MGVMVLLSDPFNPAKRAVHRLDRPATVRRLVGRHKSLRALTAVCRPGGVYGRRRVREFTRPTVCLFNGQPLLRRDWKRTTVGPGDVVAFYAPPTGGRNTLLTIVMIVAAIAIMVAAPYLGALIAPAFTAIGVGAATSLAIGTAIAGVALSAGLYGAMSLFAQPPPPDAASGFAGATPTTSPVYNLTAQGNYARLQQPIPEALGRNRMFPDFVATPYQHFDDDNNQFLHHILGLGIGEYEIDEASLKLGDTPVTSYEDVAWSVIPPGALSDTTIADERWVTSRDLADIELLDQVEGSPWGGPYVANPAGTYINMIEVDVAAPRGLWHFNPVSGGLDYRQVVFEIEAQQIDDFGAAVGAWQTYAPVTWLRNQQEVLRLTVGPLDVPVSGRWQVRVRRTDPKDDNLQSGHQLDWIGLRGRFIGRRRFAGMTCVALRMKAGADLTAAQSRQFNVVATRKLPTWTGAAMGATLAATRNPCDAFAHIARTANGGRLQDGQIDLAGLYANAADFNTKAWTFDYVFDSGVTVSEALARVARAVVAERVTQGGKLQLVRDVPTVAPVAMFSPRNITPGSLSIQYVMPDSTSPDCLIGTYIDQTIWRPVDVTVAFEDSAQLRPTRMTMYGAGTREQVREILWNLARGDRYRRRVLGWSTPMEGLAVTFGDGVSFSHDVPNYGQTLEVVDFDGVDLFTFIDPPDFSAGGVYYAAVRDSLAQKAGPFVATPVAGQPLQLRLAGALPEILTGGDRERTWLQLGPGQAYARPLKVKQVTPRDATSADLIAFDDDPRVYDPIPVEPEVPIGVDTPPLTIAITGAVGSTVNLRTLANAADYTGLAVQPVTFTQAAGVDVAIVRGSWPAGAVPILQLAGTVSGADGAPGAGGAGGSPRPAFSDPGDGQPGGMGGTGATALDSSSGPLVLTGAGTIRGGKGGGGGGGGGGGAYYETVGGGGEGGSGDITGHLVPGGTGGAGNGGAGSPGISEGGAVSGNGGTGGAAAASYAGPGATGGSGTAATGGLLFGAGGPGGPGGPGGKAIAGDANVNRAGFTGSVVGVVA